MTRAAERVIEQTRDPARIAGIAAEALLRRAEETNDPVDYDPGVDRGEAGGRDRGRDR